jgi:molecular chaperone GrpE
LMTLLEKNGLATIDAVGEKFNPELHQAIRRLESTDAKEEIVFEEYAKGYTLNERLLRPAMVSVKVPAH